MPKTIAREMSFKAKQGRLISAAICRDMLATHQCSMLVVQRGSNDPVLGITYAVRRLVLHS